MPFFYGGNAMDINAKRMELDQQISALYRERMKLNEEIASEDLEFREFLKSAIENAPLNWPECASVACQGVEGANSQEAAETIFRYPDLMYFKNFEAVFSAIESGLCEYGVLPIENSTAGSVNKIYDLMVDHKFYIVRSTRLKIEHNLMVKPGTKLREVTEIFSHEQALMQCEDYLKENFPNVKLTACGNTAEAARKVAESEGKYAAICSSRCTQLYSLENVRPSIQDHDSNYTRFICISKTPQIYPGADKTSIMATVPHKPGSLYHILGKFEEKGYNLIKLESRPIPATDFEFMFYFDYEASMYHHEFINTLCELDNLCDSMTYLGSYTEKI